MKNKDRCYSDVSLTIMRLDILLNEWKKEMHGRYIKQLRCEWLFLGSKKIGIKVKTTIWFSRSATWLILHNLWNLKFLKKKTQNNTGPSRFIGHRISTNSSFTLNIKFLLTYWVAATVCMVVSTNADTFVFKLIMIFLVRK